jgi:AAA domain/Bifunctional DNA primase/polymerase, N-terminal
VNKPLKLSPKLIASFQEDIKIDRASKHNKELAVKLAKAGIPVFLCKADKTPMPIAWEELDTAISPEVREAKRRKFVDKWGFEPLHVGCTLNTRLIREWFTKHPTAMPAISCGPAGVLVVDNDIKDRKGVIRNGVEMFDEFCAEHGGMPKGVIEIKSQNGGRHCYFAADEINPLKCSSGTLKKECESDVKGDTGLVVAPSAVRAHDGKRYGSDAECDAFLKAYTAKKLVPVPQFIRDAIGTKPEGATVRVNAKQLERPLKALAENERPDYAETFGEPALGARYDLEELRREDPEFARVVEDADGDRSTFRWKSARRLLQRWPDMTVEELAVYYAEHADDAGELTDDGNGSGYYSHTDVAKEWVKNRIASTFDAVTDEEDDEPTEPVKRVSDQPLFSYIEDVRIAEPRFIEWAIKHFLARGTTSIVSGKWGTGKTAVYTDIALHIAHGLPYRDRKVTKGVVIYVALENAEDVERRIRAWCDEMAKQGHDVSNGAFVIHRGPCALYDQRAKATPDEKTLIKIAQDASRHYGLPVSMIVIDTLSQSITPGSDREDGSIFTGAMQRIVNATGANVSTLHHPTKAGEAVRGDSALQGNVDTVIDVARESNGRGTIKAGSKFRIGDPAKVNFAYRLKPFEIGEDEDGEAITVVLAVEASVGVAMGAVEDDGDDTTLVPADTPADKLAATLRVFKERVESIAAETGEATSEIGLKAGDILAALSKDRRAAGLPELKDRTIVPRLLKQLVSAREIVKTGDNRQTEYRLTA